MKKLLLALSAAAMVAGTAASPAVAAACRNKAGKFVKCPAKPKVCRNAKGHFIKCAK